MLIDRKQIPWLSVTSLLAAAAVGVYLWDVPRPSGKWGSTPPGLTIGIIALALMLFCAALGLKRRVPHWRLGRAQTWMRGHIWLGMLTCLLVALHADFRVGGTLTLWLWALLTIVTVSGLFGWMLQQMIPSLLLHSIPGETVAQQLQRQIDALPQLAQNLVQHYAGSIDQPAPAWNPIGTGDITARPPAGGEPLRRFYLDHARAFFTASSGSRLHRHAISESLFASLRTMTPAHIHPGIAELEQLCERRHELLRQRMLMRVLTIWLIVHVPLSWMLLVMTLAHAVGALRFG